VSTDDRQFGLGRGKVFPAANAKSLLNPLRRLIQPPAALVRRLELTPSVRILEIGPGPGYFSASLAALVPEGTLVLLDLQVEMLKMARQRLEATSSAAYTNADALELPFHDRSFDAVVVVLVLGEVPDRRRCVAEVARVLKPGATAVFAETRRDGDFIRLPDLRSLVEPEGFDFVDRRGMALEYTARFTRRSVACGS
jgi:arsenite methyltransferase